MRLTACLIFSIGLILLPGCGGNTEPETAASAANQVRNFDVDIKAIDLPVRHYLVLRQRLPLDNMNGFMAIECAALKAAAAEAGIKAKGPLTGLFYEWDTEQGIGEAAVALPVNAAVELAGYVNIELPATQAIAAELEGPYTGLGAIHFGMEAQLKLQKRSAKTPSIEEYIVGPADGAQEADFKTRIIYPIAD